MLTNKKTFFITMKFSTADLAALNSKGIEEKKAERQIASFRDGFPYLPITRAAVVGDGILRLPLTDAQLMAKQWDQTLAGGGVIVEKFVPASGAATRMFKEYFELLSDNKMTASVKHSIENVEKFAFAADLHSLGIDMKDPRAVVDAILTPSGLDYGIKPKALLKFHHYDTENRTAAEEHLVEGALYGQSRGRKVKIHFTVSPEHREGFEKLVAARRSVLENRYNVTYDITYSEQKSSTDTLAVDMENKPFRIDDGHLLFRPAGHGALIENLNEIAADLLFVKTIDNVLPDHRKADTITYKKALAAIGTKLQKQIFAHIEAIDKGGANLEEIRNFIEHSVGYKFAEGEVSASALRAVLDRPIRICGMVKNEGEPGGGPFWVKANDGSQSVQIAESSQIAPEQKSLMADATHFNPVDLVCLVKNYHGGKFDLSRFVDHSTGFISEKSYAGRPLKAQELPGLWNGAMANWTTLFVEVPITTFAPVKVLGDLLRPDHQ